MHGLRQLRRDEQHAEARDLRRRQQRRTSARRARFRAQREARTPTRIQAVALIAYRRERAPAPSAPRGDARARSRRQRRRPAAPARTGASSARRRAPTRTGATAAASVSSCAGNRDQSSAIGPPPPVPSNDFENQPAPRATAFHATRCSGSPRWYSRRPARSASSPRPVARGSMPCAPGGSGGGCASGRRIRRCRSAGNARTPSRATGRADAATTASRVRAARGRAPAPALRASPSASSPPRSRPSHWRRWRVTVIARRSIAPLDTASENTTWPPANASLAASGLISMPARLRNVCSSAAATRPPSRNVTPRPSDSA